MTILQGHREPSSKTGVSQQALYYSFLCRFRGFISGNEDISRTEIPQNIRATERDDNAFFKAADKALYPPLILLRYA
jgi:hypothetical protein